MCAEIELRAALRLGLKEPSPGSALKTSQGHLRNLGGRPTHHRFKGSRNLNVYKDFQERCIGCPVGLKIPRDLFTHIQPARHAEVTAGVALRGGERGGGGTVCANSCPWPPQHNAAVNACWMQMLQEASRKV